MLSSISRKFGLAVRRTNFIGPGARLDHLTMPAIEYEVINMLRMNDAFNPGVRKIPGFLNGVEKNMGDTFEKNMRHTKFADATSDTGEGRVGRALDGLHNEIRQLVKTFFIGMASLSASGMMVAYQMHNYKAAQYNST